MGLEELDWPVLNLLITKHQC